MKPTNLIVFSISLLLFYSCDICDHDCPIGDEDYLETSPIAYFPFNGDANDMSINGNHGIPHNVTLTEDRYGDFNSAYYFDGNTAYIDVPNSSSLKTLTKNLTITAWVYPYNQYYNTIIAKGSSQILVDFAKYLRPGFTFRGLDVDYSEAENYWDRLLVYNNIPSREWSHIACSYNSADSLIRIFINGKLIHSCTASGELSSDDNDFRIGARISEKYTEYFKGKLDEIRIYNKALSGREIFSIMNK